jgi:hypothetical protein
MTTSIEKGGPTPLVSATPTAYRTTATPHRPFQAVMSASADAVMSGAEAAVTELPGGPVLAASFRSSHQVPAHLTATGSGPPPATPSGADASNSSGEPKVENLLSETANQNLYFLQLQESLAAENRQYTALSNVLRARHETVKNAIGNIR